MVRFFVVGILPRALSKYEVGGAERSTAPWATCDKDANDVKPHTSSILSYVLGTRVFGVL
jgi:hypothetical protein